MPTMTSTLVSVLTVVGAFSSNLGQVRVFLIESGAPGLAFMCADVGGVGWAGRGE